jgi:regulator of RNase E activity RraB
MAPSPSPVIRDHWQSYVSMMDKRPLFISFDYEAGREPPIERLSNCARVLIPIHEPGDGGGPNSEEAETLWAMEDDLCNRLSVAEVDCLLVGRLTHGGVRELVFQLADWESFRPPVGLWMSEVSDYDIEISEHEGWDFFDQVVRPNDEDWLFIADVSVIENLKKAGSDLSREHALEFCFRGEAEGLQELAIALTARGYEPYDELNYESGQIVFVRRMVPDIHAVTTESRELHQLCQEIGVEYDGWGTAVVKS